MLHSFDEFVNENLKSKEETAKKAALDFVEERGKATWKEIHTFLMQRKGLGDSNKDNRGNMASYFSGSPGASSSDSGHGRTRVNYGLLMIPTKKDPRYLVKDGKYYVVAIWDRVSRL